MKKFRLATLQLEAFQASAHDLVPKTSFLLKSLGCLVEFVTSSDVLVLNHPVDQPRGGLNFHAASGPLTGNRGGIVPLACSDDP